MHNAHGSILWVPFFLQVKIYSQVEDGQSNGFLKALGNLKESIQMKSSGYVCMHSLYLVYIHIQQCYPKQFFVTKFLFCFLYVLISLDNWISVA